MLEAYFAAACVGLLLLLAFAMVTVDRQHKSLIRERDIIARLDRLALGLQAERSEILEDVGMLESLLKAARKNDNRDASGRFAKASHSVTFQPQSYSNVTVAKPPPR